MAIWRDEVVAALSRLGKVSTLDEIYSEVRKTRTGKLPTSWKAIIRRELEYNSSDSESHQKRFDLFKNEAIGSGRWSLRELPEQSSAYDLTGADVGQPPKSVIAITKRIVRDTVMIRALKRLYDDCCQLCRSTLRTESGLKYSEGHHVKPLSGSHNGPDTKDNILILCPNCHALCDLGFIALDADAIHWQTTHRVKSSFIDYHNDSIHRKELQTGR